MPSITNVASSNPDHGEMYSIQCTTLCDEVYFSDLWQFGFLLVFRFPSPADKTDRHDITEILLKLSLNVNQTGRK